MGMSLSLGFLRDFLGVAGRDELDGHTGCGAPGCGSVGCCCDAGQLTSLGCAGSGGAAGRGVGPLLRLKDAGGGGGGGRGGGGAVGGRGRQERTGGAPLVSPPSIL
mmetsp:Transcript_36551/g.73682  ORF Transcript_36551/g.73682 Transcript_36551/m.73682 type:complete len:106 (+) Transcript_36551:342-659(+)